MSTLWRCFIKLFLASPSIVMKYEQDMLEYYKQANILESFFYVQKDIDIQKICKNFLLDSGAYSFLNSGKIVDWDEYIEEYIAYINKYDIQYFFELDIDKIVGYEKVLGFRKKIENGTNKKSIPVWHRSRGIEIFIQDCKNYDYIAIGGLAIRTIKSHEYDIILSKLISIANLYNCKVHLLGRINEVKKYNAYSGDSTTWSMCGRGGAICEIY